MAKINKIQEYAVLWLNSQNLSIEGIIAETGLSKRQINNILKKQQSSDTVPIKSPSSNINTKNLMIMDSGAKKFRVAIMTKDASMANDSIVKNLPNNTNQTNFIYRPNNG